MAAVSAQPRLSFDHDLKHAYTPISLRLQSGAKSLDGVLEILRMRIEAESVFCSSLQKIIGCSTNLMSDIPSTESVRRDGLDALYSDLKNEYTQRMAYLNSLKEDVQGPLHKMKDYYYSQNKIFQNQTKSNNQILKKHQKEFLKLKEKYDKIMKPPSKGDKILNNKSKKQQLLNIKKKYQDQKLIWEKQKKIFDNKQISTLQRMESNEYKRLNALRDGITNWSAYITNLAANRSYDIQNLARSMALINVEDDLQNWMQHTLMQHPAPTPSPLITPSSIPSRVRGATIPITHGVANNKQIYRNNINNTKQHYPQPKNINLPSMMMLSNLKKQPTTDYIQTLFKKPFQKQSLSSSSLESAV